jgi:hypothetical protein
MLKAWRRAAVSALAAGAAITSQLMAITPAQAAAPVITISATAAFNPVRGYVLVWYLDGTYSVATIRGTITGAAKGEVAALYAQQFPYRHPAVRLSAMTLKTSAKTAYSFTVAPDLATRYAVRLFASGTARAPLATSPALNVYVAPYAYYTGGQVCSRPVCTETFHEYLFVPTTAIGVEMSDHMYPYFGINLSPTGAPPPPKFLYIYGGNASVSAARRISADEFEKTIRYSFTVGNEGYYWGWLSCIRDNEARNGIGLPGFHGCGAGRVPNTNRYFD